MRRDSVFHAFPALVHSSRAPGAASACSWAPQYPMTAFKRSQAKYVKKSCRTTDWPEYEAGLRDAVFRYKTITGPTTRSRTLHAQRVECGVGCRFLNTTGSNQPIPLACVDLLGQYGA